MDEKTLPFWAFGIRSVVILIVMFVAFRLLGKRQVAQMNIYDLAMIMALANGVQNAMTGGRGDLPVALAASTSLVLVAYGITRLLVRNPKLEERLIGSPTVLINDGEVLAGRLRKERVTQDELMAVLRAHGITEPKQVKLAVLEVDGSISVIPKAGPGGGGGGKKKKEA